MNEKITLEDLINRFSLISHKKEIEELAVDLNDIYESSKDLEKLLVDIINFQKDKEI